MVGRGDLRAPPSHARRRIVERGYDETAFDDYYLAGCAGLGRNARQRCLSMRFGRPPTGLLPVPSTIWFEYG